MSESQHKNFHDVPPLDTASDQLVLFGKKTTRKNHDHAPAYLADDLPVAKVLLENHLPHLDRTFDYGVPRDLAEVALPGTRVKVRFAGQNMMGWLIQRCEDSQVPRDRLLPLQRVVSLFPVLTQPTLAAAQLVAARSAGVVSDVLRTAIPPRVASVEKKAFTESGGNSKNSDDVFLSHAVAKVLNTAAKVWSLYHNGEATWEVLTSENSSRGPVRAVVQAMPAHHEHTHLDLVAHAVAATYAQGRGAIVAVPDAKTLDRLQQAMSRWIPEQVFARLHSDDKPTPRYRSFVELLQKQRMVAIGTRPAVWSPVHKLGLIVVINDGDSNFVEQRAPYHHARDVALLRSEHEKVDLLLVSHSVTPEAQRLVDTGWATRVYPERRILRQSMPRIFSTSDSWHAEHDSLGKARLPETAFRITRGALEHGPVLVQVARTGYAPTIACQRCRTPARCTACDGPLRVFEQNAFPQCAWCARQAWGWSCRECAATQWRMVSVGAQRTAEELGRAFPQVPVIASSGETIQRSVGAEPALVIATPGAEPWAEGKYAAALLLDGDRMLSMPGLRTEEKTLQRWFAACALVRSRSAGGVVVVTSEHERSVDTLVRWDPSMHAIRELAERKELQLPPAVRSASLTGTQAALHDFLNLLELETQNSGIRIIGPSPVTVTDSQHTYRVLMFFPYSVAHNVTQRLRSVRAQASALRRHSPVQVRCDVSDLL